MARITVDGKVDDVFDDDELEARYCAEFTADDGVAVYVEVRRDGEVLVTVPIARYGPDIASGYGEGD